MTNDLSKRLAALSGGGLQRSIAHDVWPTGATLSCDRCGAFRSITSGQAGSYLAHGWPTCCGETMKLSVATPETEHG